MTDTIRYIPERKDWKKNSIDLDSDSSRIQKATQHQIGLWNPDDFMSDLRYFKGKHQYDLEMFLKKKFKRNYANLAKNIKFITKNMINGMSNIFKYPLILENEIDVKLKEKIERVLHNAEKFENLNDTALIKIYEDGEIKFEALHCSYFTYQTSEEGDIDLIAERGGSFFKNIPIESDPEFFKQSVIFRWYILKKEGNIWVQYFYDSEQFSDIPEFKEGKWTQSGEKYPYCPFFIFNRPLIDFVQKCPIVELENNYIENKVRSNLGIKVGLLQQFAAEGADKDQIKKIGEILGYSNAIVSVPLGGKLETLNSGNLDNHLKEVEISESDLKTTCVQLGINYNRVIPDNKIESGVAKRYRLNYINDVRDDKIPDYKDIAYRFFEWLNTLPKINLSVGEIEISPLPPLMDQTEKEEIISKKFNNLKMARDEKTITEEEYIEDVRRLFDYEYSEKTIDEILKSEIGEDEIEVEEEIIKDE